mmetsp:Transcript_16863/g.26322  ORF Transcript_16863/g.26322 Transcript_16863/m.26322 type:complete len:216 (+) Transcript_16863:107-754(+)|eukprot:CAMPEP_0196814598 /NCGR_PEP_ID=MMETSP1362-20130617/44408_1 /TAXON_ID=163516 /ORGANISM="Leptocylindrus danicus, Strain CCMP1856" /LENGTH=215 /DNA_ID=CAMNT_0042191275 /DNA_START=100 /DNA_END=747 /DNA_ORIENTATION=-
MSTSKLGKSLCDLYRAERKTLRLLSTALEGTALGGALTEQADLLQQLSNDIIIELKAYTYTDECSCEEMERLNFESFKRLLSELHKRRASITTQQGCLLSDEYDLFVFGDVMKQLGHEMGLVSKRVHLARDEKDLYAILVSSYRKRTSLLKATTTDDADDAATPADSFSPSSLTSMKITSAYAALMERHGKRLEKYRRDDVCVPERDSTISFEVQ